MRRRKTVQLVNFFPITATKARMIVPTVAKVAAAVETLLDASV
jgi:hypothetical protein